MNHVAPPRQPREIHFFAGSGGGILAGMLHGHRTVCAVEIDRRGVGTLLNRQRDGALPQFPIWDDIRTFDGKPWRGRAEIVCGGFPCTDISPARTNSKTNGKQKGIMGESSGLWHHMRRGIAEIQPRLVVIENSPVLRTRGLSVVLQNLAAMGYDAKWGVLGVRHFGADHTRERMFIVATHSDMPQLERRRIPSGTHSEHAHSRCPDWWENQPGLERVANGMANQMDRLWTIGNGQVPSVAALAFHIFTL